MTDLRITLYNYKGRKSNIHELLAILDNTVTKSTLQKRISVHGVDKAMAMGPTDKSTSKGGMRKTTAKWRNAGEPFDDDLELTRLIAGWKASGATPEQIAIRARYP